MKNLFMRDSFITILDISIVFFMGACNRNIKKGQFQVTIEVRNTPAQKIYLRKWYRDSLPIVDSARLTPDKPIAVFKGNLKEESLFSLNFSRKGRQYDIIVSDTPVHIIVDCERPGFMIVNGSQSTKINNEIKNQIVSIGRIRHQVIDSLKLSGAPTYLIQEEEKRADSLEKIHVRDMNNWLMQTSSPILAFELLSTIVIEEGYNPNTEMLIQNSSEKFSYNQFFKQTSIDYDKLIQYHNEANKYPLKLVDFTLQSNNNQNFNLFHTIHDNKYTLIDFWASWCAPCRTELPFLSKAYSLYQKKGFQIVSVSLDKNKIQWVNAIKKYNMNWSQLILDSRDSQIAKEYGITLIPKSLLVNRKGKIIARNLRGNGLITKLDSLFDPK